jgi:hypothetical protein
MVAYESGIRNFCDERLSFSVQFLMMGAKIITTGVLFRKAEINETGNMILGIRNAILLLLRGKYDCANRLRIPDCLTPSLTRNKIATVIIALFENPFKASSSLIIPNTSRMVVAEKSIRPGLIISLKRAIIIAKITPKTMYPSFVSNVQ